MTYENRQYMIFNVSEIENVDFNEVMESSPETIRKSLDNTKTFVKWSGDTIPNSIDLLTTKDGPYTHSEIMDILSTNEWTNVDEIITP